jgi:hypothetical protein
VGVPEEGLSVTVIDLDLPASPPATSAPPPVHRYRRLALVVAGLLTLALGGAAPAAPVLWRHVGSVPAPEAEVAHGVAGELLVVTALTGDRPTTSGWRLDPPRRLWSVTLPESAVGVATVSGDDVLVQHAHGGVSVLDPATGAVRWSSPVYVQVLNPRFGLSTAPEFAPGTAYDETSGDPGPLYFDGNGQPHTQPPRHTDLYGIDLATGRRLWSAREAGAVYSVPVPGIAGALVVVTAGAVEVRDAATGASLRRRSLPPTGAGDVWYPEVAGDALLIRRGDTATAYGLDTLEPRWNRTEPADAGFPFCQALLCRREAGTLVVLDPRTGRTAWDTGVPDVQLSLGGDEVLVHGALGDRPQSIRDAASGAVRADLSRWDTLIDFTAEGDLMVSGYHGERGGRVFGVRPPGAATVQPLGVSTGLLRDCVRSAALVACRGTDAIEVFAYRAGR